MTYRVDCRPTATICRQNLVEARRVTETNRTRGDAAPSHTCRRKRVVALTCGVSRDSIGASLSVLHGVIFPARLVDEPPGSRRSVRASRPRVVLMVRACATPWGRCIAPPCAVSWIWSLAPARSPRRCKLTVCHHVIAGVPLHQTSHHDASVEWRRPTRVNRPPA